MRSLLINYKAYKEGIDNGLEIARIADDIAKKLGVEIVVAPPFTLLKEVSEICTTISQAIDEVEPGAFTAHISWYEVKKSGAIGTLLNHSEKRYVYSKGGDIVYPALKKAIDACKMNGLRAYVCVQNLEEAGEVLRMKPYAIAYEPPELIGGEVSVSSAQPETVKRFVDIVKKDKDVQPLIGAGIKNAEDVGKSVELGSAGVLVASGIVKAKDYKTAIEELAKPLTN